jgi:hypothetical protein
MSQSQQTRTFLLLYRRQSINIQQYLNYLANVLNMYTIDLVFGDFNIDFLNDSQHQPLRLLMESSSLKQVVNYPTFISGSLLDHVYVRTTSLYIIQNVVINVYYSDHDAIRLIIQYRQ